jgi:hypothetical protein
MQKELQERGPGNTLAIASAALDSPFAKAVAEARRICRYQKASADVDVGLSRFSFGDIPLSFRAADPLRKAAADRRSLPIQIASSATRRFASRSPLGPWLNEFSPSIPQTAFAFRRHSMVSTATRTWPCLNNRAIFNLAKASTDRTAIECYELSPTTEGWCSRRRKTHR